MSDGEKYWHDEAMQLREEVARLKPLEHYSSLLNYMAENPETIQGVMDHMKGIRSEEGTPGGDIERELYGDGVNGKTNQNATTAPQNTAQPTQGNNANALEGAEIESKRRMFAEMQRLLMEEGMPAHQADQHIKMMMSPGEITAAEALEMYKTLTKSRAGGTGQPDNTGPHGANPEPAKEVGNNGIPPMSVVGLSGGNDNQTSPEVVGTDKDRIALDPNTA